MARQASVLKLTGRIGDLSFYYNKQFGFIARQKGGANAARIASDPQFARTRENAREFGMAVQAAKLLRHAVKGFLHVTGDSSVTQRLNQQAVSIARMDSGHARGERTFAGGLMNSEARVQLRSFAFHAACPLSYVLPAPPVYTPGSGTVVIPGLVPARDFAAPAAATHVRLQSMTGFFRFEEQDCTVFTTPAVVLPLDEQSHTVSLLPSAVPQGAGLQLGFLSVVFLQEQNGVFSLLSQGTAAGVVG